MKAKIFSVLILMSIMVLAFSSVVMAKAIPDFSVVIGSQAFALDYANDSGHVSEIRQAIVADGDVFVKAGGNWYNNTTGLITDASRIPAVQYKDVT